MKGTPRTRGVAVAVALCMAVAACGSTTDGDDGEDAAGSSELAAACGRKLVLQTDWFPEPEHGGLYQVIGPNGKVNKERGAYIGPIGDTGVELEIRAGGPFSGNQQVSSLIYQDPTIFGGFVNTDEAVQLSGKLPTVGVFTLLDISPSALMWDPAKYQFKSFADIGKSQAKVLYFEGTAFMTYLIGKGDIREDQADPSYDGSPSRFVTEGDIVQEAFATNEPYKYEHDIKEWNKPVDFLLVSDSGYQPYPENIAVRPETLKEKAGCLRLLVPILQQAQVDYVRNPGPVNGALLREVEELDTEWTLSPGGVADAVDKMLKLKIVNNSPLGSLGSYDLPRVERMIDLLTPIYEKEKITTVKAGLKAADIATNEFIDPNIRL